jgi:hypothetical protein
MLGRQALAHADNDGPGHQSVRQVSQAGQGHGSEYGEVHHVVCWSYAPWNRCSPSVAGIEHGSQVLGWVILPVPSEDGVDLIEEKGPLTFGETAERGGCGRRQREHRSGSQ